MLSPPPTPATMEPSTSGGKRGKRGRRDDDARNAVEVVVEKLPARTLVYAVLPKTPPQPAEAASPQAASPTPAEDAEPTLPSLEVPEGCELLLAPPPRGAPRGSRICEFSLLRAVKLARCAQAPSADALPPPLAEHGCDGWRWGTTDADARVVLLDPSALLRLVDDDKQSGLAQMTLTDMFTRSFSRGCSVSASPAASSSMDP